MREIKFRAWDKVSKMFVYFTVKLGEEVFLDPTRFAEELYLRTGLKDKNGKEIYEGDIVKYHKGETVFQIVWYESGFYFAWLEGMVSYPLKLSGNYKVIGNIYENPALLEAK